MKSTCETSAPRREGDRCDAPTPNGDVDFHALSKGNRFNPRNQQPKRMKTQRSIYHFAATLGLALLPALAARADYQATVLSDSPLAFYALDPASDPSDTSPDLTGNGNDGVAVNITPATGPSAYIPNAANFNGSAAIDLSLGSNPALLNFSGPITLEAWVQPSSASEFADIIAKGYDSSTYQEIFIRVDGPYGAIFDGSSGSKEVSGGTQTTNWTYVVLSSDGTNCTLYQNGVKVAQAPDTTGSVMFSDDWMIGNGSSAGNGRLFNGNISEVAIYNHGLTAAQVLNHYFVGMLNTPATLSVPIISSQPQSQPSYIGGTVTFTVSATSALPVTNQWYYGSTPLPGQTNSSLTLANLQLSNSGNYSVVVGNANGTTNSAVAVLTVNTPRNLQWSPNANTGVWDQGLSANWLNVSNSLQTIFNAGDQALFDDTPGVPTSVTVSNTVYPSLVTVDANNNTYNFSGPGSIGGSGTLIKKGTSTLTLTTPSGFAGNVKIGGGTIYAGNNCFSSIGSITVSNNSTLDFGGGQFNNVTPVTVSGTGSSGQGALINSYADYPSEKLNVTLAGDTLFGGTARWDMASGSQVSGAYNLTLDWSAAGNYGQWNSVTVGANVLGVTVTNGSSLGITGMDTSCQNPGTLFNIGANGQLVLYSGGFNGSVHLASGATMYVYSANVTLGGSNLILDNGSALQTYYNDGANPVNSAVTLNGIVHFVLGDHTENFTNVISGPGGFTLDYYNHAMVLSASNTYSGPTSIGGDGNSIQVSLTGNGSISHSSVIFFQGSSPSATHVDATGRSDQTLTLANGQTLAGVGAVNGNLVVSSGAIVSPSGTNAVNGSTSTNAVGAIAASDNITLNGTTILKLDGSGSNDMVQAGANITFGGTLNLVNISSTPLAAGNSFHVFSAANYNGSFSSITPSTPGVGLAWDTTQLNTGVINVIASSGGPSIASTKVSGGKLIFSGTGGSASGTYYVLTTTNLAGPWMFVATNSYDASGNFNVTNTMPAGVPQQFYRIEQ